MNDTTGSRLKQVRGRLSRDEFAPLLGVHKQTLMRYENGQRCPDAEFLASLALRFDLNCEWLLLGRGEMLRSRDGSAPRGIDTQLLAAVIAQTEEGLQARGVRLADDKKAQLIVLLYEESLKQGQRPDPLMVDRLVALVA